ncbi:MAG: pyruvate, phosphate dikinase [Candidatus Nanoarchaeia archaeon]|nr:pyruvate, phosphate dikinase [Candidatus Nanoarchaeia archaeon]
MVVEKFVYSFKEGNKEMKELLGGKGAFLSDMTSIGLPVPNGFTITTKACEFYYKNNKKLSKEIQEQILEKLNELERDTGKKLGERNNPLLVSVRSGAAASMPGMMDTILNLGLNDETVEGLSIKTGNSRFAYDSYRRFIQMFGDVVMGVEHKFFEEILQRTKMQKGVKFDNELNSEDLKKLVEMYKQLIKIKTNRMFPSDVHEQLDMAIDAVFNSWNNDRAITYRRLNNIFGLLGTAVNIQSMVFGNMGEDSGTGVCFTRNPSTGENKFYGEFLMNAQGEDVVAGIRTPRKIEELETVMPSNYLQLINIRKILENHYRDMQDIEFTIEKGKLYILQTRNGKRTSPAAVRIAVEMVENGMINKETALLRIEPSSLNQLLHKQLDNNSKRNGKLLTKGLPASPGAAVGRIVFNAEDAYEWAEKGEKVVLVRLETSPEDIEGMHSSQGILTGRGGMTSHAAVVARGMGKCCVAGCSDLIINEAEKIIEINGKRIREGEFITLDGSSGEVFLGKLELVEPALSGNFGKIMQWADEHRKIGVRTNADTPKDASTAVKFGAEGIGLCRTEHMFFEESRIKAMREMILSNNKQEREKALAKLLPMQRGDFYSLFQIMNGMPVTIRFLDPPLHEFLPKEKDKIQELAREMGVSEELLKEKTEELHEFNPMLGHRGCRLGITFPEITEMQSRAVFEAAAELIKEGKSIIPEVMIPIVGNLKEFEHQKKIVDETAEKVMKENNIVIEYKVGTMIEVPRAAVTADKLAEKAEFFSFGTNDLTQMGCGFSRDDSAKFLKEYVELGIYKRDPFETIDQEGVGELMKIAIQKAKPIRQNLKLGICGEHGGDPETIEFCYKIGLSYVSCSPFRVPIARLAGAQASIKEKKKIEENAYKKIIQESILEIKNKFGDKISVDELEKELHKKINPKAVEECLMNN